MLPLCSSHQLLCLRRSSQQRKTPMLRAVVGSCTAVCCSAHLASAMRALMSSSSVWVISSVGCSRQ